LISTEHYNIVPNKLFDVGKYFDAYKIYKDQGNLLIGVELDMQRGAYEGCKSLVDRYPFDMVIGSMHTIDKIDLYQYDFTKVDQTLLYKNYLEKIDISVNKYAFIDVLGHIDYICRKSTYDIPYIDYTKYSDLIDTIFKSLLKNNIVLELNTYTFDNAMAISYLLPLYKRYKAMGGRYVTIGSDGHKINTLARHFKKAYEFIDICGLCPVYFKNHKMELML
jgi:histidinol-phosphatase (PHP family)